MLKDIILECSSIDDCRRNYLFKAIKVVDELQGPKMFRDSMNQNMLQEELNIIKASWESCLLGHDMTCPFIINYTC